MTTRRPVYGEDIDDYRASRMAARGAFGGYTPFDEDLDDARGTIQAYEQYAGGFGRPSGRATGYSQSQLRSILSRNHTIERFNAIHGIVPKAPAPKSWAERNLDTFGPIQQQRLLPGFRSPAFDPTAGVGRTEPPWMGADQPPPARAITTGGTPGGRRAGAYPFETGPPSPKAEAQRHPGTSDGQPGVESSRSPYANPGAYIFPVLPPSQEKVALFEEIGGDLEGLRSGFASEKKDPIAMALAAFSRRDRIALMIEAGWDPVMARERSIEIDHLFGLTGKPDADWPELFKIAAAYTGVTTVTEAAKAFARFGLGGAAMLPEIATGLRIETADRYGPRFGGYTGPSPEDIYKTGEEFPSWAKFLAEMAVFAPIQFGGVAARTGAWGTRAGLGIGRRTPGFARAVMGGVQTGARGAPGVTRAVAGGVQAGVQAGVRGTPGVLGGTARAASEYAKGAVREAPGVMKAGFRGAKAGVSLVPPLARTAAETTLAAARKAPSAGLGAVREVPGVVKGAAKGAARKGAEGLGIADDFYRERVLAPLMPSDVAMVPVKAAKAAKAAKTKPLAPPPRRFETQWGDAIPGEPLVQALKRQKAGRENALDLEISGLLKSANEKIAQLGINLETKAGKDAILLLFRKLHDKSVPLPAAYRPMYVELKAILKAEEKLMAAFDPVLAKQFMAHPDYFPRAWAYKGKQIDTIKGITRLGQTPGFKRPRNGATFDEMIALKFTPSSWNPYVMVAQRLMDGEIYRNSRRLMQSLQQNGLAATKKDLMKDQGSLQGWKVPRIGPAFEGMPYVADKTKAGNPKWMKTNPIFVPDKVANALQDSMARMPELLIRDVNVIPITRYASNFAKSMKLVGSMFQHADFLTRAGGVALTPTAMRSGATLTFPGLLYRVLNSTFLPSARKGINERIRSGKAFTHHNGEPISLIGIVREGWEAGGDLSLIQKGGVGFVEDGIAIAKLNKLPVVGLAARRLKALNDWWQDGLFKGLYPEVQMWALENFIVPALKRNHPGWTATQISADAARQVNIMFSTLGTWQTVFRNPYARELVHTFMFSSNETEALIRQGVGMLRSGNRKFWVEYHLGLLTFMAGVSNAIHFAATGKPLPLEAYNPIKLNAPWNAFKVDYDGKFFSPQLPWLKGRGNTPVTYDVVGQMDTILRIGTNPWGAILGRTNVIPRAILNQARGYAFGNVKMSGPKERALHAVFDLFGPMAGVSFLEAATQAEPKIAGWVPPTGEGRIGILGNLLQGTGINLRGEQTADFLDRVTREAGYVDDKGTLIERYKETGRQQGLMPSQQKELKNRPDIKYELDIRNLEGQLRGNDWAEARITVDKIDADRINQEQAIADDWRTDPRISTQEAIDQIDEANVKASTARRTYYRTKNLEFDDGEIAAPGTREEAETQYFMLFEPKPIGELKESGKLDGDLFQIRLAELEKGWNADQRAFINDMRQTKDHADDPFVQNLFELRQLRRDNGWYEIWRQIPVFRDVFPVAYQHVYEEYREHVRGGKEADFYAKAAKKGLESHLRETMGDMDKLVELAQDEMRFADPNLDYLSSKVWGKSDNVAGVARSPATRARLIEEGAAGITQLVIPQKNWPHLPASRISTKHIQVLREAEVTLEVIATATIYQLADLLGKSPRSLVPWDLQGQAQRLLDLLQDREAA